MKLNSWHLYLCVAYLYVSIIVPRRCLKAIVGIFSMVSLCSYGKFWDEFCCSVLHFSQLTSLTFQGWPPHSVTIFKMRPDHCFVQLGHFATVNMFKGSSYET